MDDRADYDDLAWDKNDDERDRLQKQFFLISTLRALESIVKADLQQDARWVRPVHIGGYSLVYTMELTPSNSRVVIRLPRPHVAHFAQEKTSQEIATIKLLSQHTKLSTPAVLSSGRHSQFGYYIILPFVENDGLLSRALSIPIEDPEEPPMLNMDMEDPELEAHFYNLAVHLQHLFKPALPAIGSLAQAPDGSFVVGGRPLTQNMYNMVYLANIPASVLPEANKTYRTADDWYTALAEMHMLQLTFQHNDLVKDVNDCRNKHIARYLFLSLARAGKLSTFGFIDDSWSAQTKTAATRGYCGAPSNTQSFHVWCDDFRPGNILVHNGGGGGGEGGTVIDWEFTYAAPTQFALDPPWWLLLDIPEMWHLGMDDWAQKYSRCLEIWLQAMKKAERDIERAPDGNVLSQYMQDSWSTGRFWLNYAARKSWAFDSIFWEHLDERFFGQRSLEPDRQEPLWKARAGLLNPKEIAAMETFVDRKMRESQERKLVTWDPREAQGRKEEVLYQPEQSSMRQC